MGGHIVPRPHDKSLCYIGGDTRIVVVDRNASLNDLIARLSKTLIGSNPCSFVLKYQLPSEDLDSLISISNDEDLENMIEEYDRLNSNSTTTGKLSRIRLFLFPVNQEFSSSSIGSLLENSIKSEDWFLNALNGGSSVGGLSGSNSVNSLLGLNDDVVNVKGGTGGLVGKNVDVHSVVESLDRTSSFGSDVHSSGLGLGNLAPIRVKEDKVGGEENVGGNGNGKVDDGGFVGADVGKGAANVSSEKLVGDNVARGSDDEKSEHGGTGYRRQLQQQQQAQLVYSQLNQKSGGGGGGRDLASPDSVSRYLKCSNIIYCCLN